MKRGLAIGACSFLAALLSVCLLTAWALGTGAGARLLWRGAGGLVDGLEAAGVEGRLLGPLSVRDLRYSSDDLELHIGTIDLDWAPGALLRRTLRVTRLRVVDVSITRRGDDEAPEESVPLEVPKEFALPVAIELQDVSLASLLFRADGDSEPLIVDSADLVGRFSGHDLSITRLAADGPLFAVEAQARLETRGDYPAQASVNWTARPPGFAPLTGALTLEGGLSSLRITQRIEAPYPQTHEVEVRDLPGDLSFVATVEVEDTRLGEIAGTLPPAVFAGRARISGAPTDLEYELSLTAETVETGMLSLSGEGRFRDQVLALTQLRLMEPAGAASFRATGSIDLSDTTASMDVRGDWDSLRWPLQGEPRIASPRGTTTLRGSMSDYRLDVDTDLAVPGQGEGHLRLRGSGSTEAFELADLQLALLDGTLAGQGRLRWSPALAGDITLTGEGLDPSPLLPDYPGDLRLEVRASGSRSGDGLNARIEPLSVVGSLRDRPLALRVTADVADSAVAIEEFDLEAGESRVDLRGTLAGDSLDLKWHIDSGDLGDLLPEASGSLAGSGTVSGSTALPAVRGTADGNAMRFADFALDRVALEIDVDLESTSPSRIDLTADGARLGDATIAHAALTGAGTRHDHTLRIEAEMPQGAAQLDISGDLQADHWEMVLEEGRVLAADLAPWTLAERQRGRISTTAQHLEPACWESGDARLCLQGDRTPARLEGTASLQSLPLAYLRPLLPDTLEADGLVDAQAHVEQDTGGAPTVALTVDTGPMELRTGASAAEPDSLLLGLAPSALEIDLRNTRLTAAVDMPIASGGTISGRLATDGDAGPLAEQTLQGEVRLSVEDMGFLATLVPDVDRAAGALNGRVTISGTVGRPVPDGEFRLTGGALQLASPGLDVSDIALRVSSAGVGRLRVDGTAESGGGRLQLDGDLRLADGETEADLSIEGDAFQVVDTVEARVFVSPDLQLALTPTAVRLTGEIAVPRAEITPKQLPAGAVTVSSDQVVLREDAGSETNAAQRSLDARVRIALGDDVSVDGFGFRGRLAGGVTVEQQPGRPTLGSGELTIIDGEYRAYGQGLVIEQGKILFAGGPIDQPGISVRAVRRPAENVLVGVRVSGPLQEPDFAVFSEPAMGQTEQLSWLVLGRPLKGASEGENDMIAQAAMALGVKGGNFLADRIGGDLGVDSFGIETGNGEAGAASDVNQAAFVIGKYLSPELFVSYGIGLFDSVSTVRLEYSLGEHWKLSTESSTLSSGGDVTYTIER